MDHHRFPPSEMDRGSVGSSSAALLHELRLRLDPKTLRQIDDGYRHSRPSLHGRTNADWRETSEHHEFWSRIAAFDLDPLIVQDDDTGSESLRCGELHLHLFGLPEANLAAANEERVDPDLELVEQISLQKRLPEAAVTIDDQVFAILLLEFRRPRRDVAADDGAVAPFRLPQGVREDVLSDLVDPLAVRTCLMRKGLREEFVRMPPHQHRVARGEQVKRVLFRLVIEVLRGPGVRVSEDPVE